MDSKKDPKSITLIETKKTPGQKKNLKKLSTPMNCLKISKDVESMTWQDKTILKACQEEVSMAEDSLEEQGSVSISKIWWEALVAEDSLEEDSASKEDLVSKVKANDNSKEEVREHTHLVSVEEHLKEWDFNFEFLIIKKILLTLRSFTNNFFYRYQTIWDANFMT